MTTYKINVGFRRDPQSFPESLDFVTNAVNEHIALGKALARFSELHGYYEAERHSVTLIDGEWIE